MIASVLCLKCGRELCKQVVGELCAYCRHPISDSVYGDYLIHADRAEVREMAEMARFLRYSFGFLGGLVLIGLVTTIAAGIGQRDLREGLADAFNILFAGALIAPVIAFIGVSVLTRRGHLAYYRARYWKQPYILWSSLAFGIVVVGLLIVSVFWDRLVVNLVIALWAATPTAAFLKGLQRLMRRVPDKQLADFANFAFWCAVFGGLAFYTLLLLRSVPLEWGWGDVQTGMTTICVIGCIALAVGGYRLLGAVEISLRKAAR